MDEKATMSNGRNGVDEDNEGDEIEYKVEKIVGRRMQKGKLQYHIKWDGYPESDNTWEDADQLDIPEIIDDFEKTRDQPDNNEDAEDSHEGETPGSKRGRGRPPKVNKGRLSNNSTDSAVTANPTPNKKETPLKKNSEVPKRARGRPRKSAPDMETTNGHVTGDECDISSLSFSLPPTEMSSSESSKSPRKRGRPPKSPSKSAADAIVKKAKMSPTRRSQSPFKIQSPTEKTVVKGTPTKRSPSKETPSKRSPRKDNSTMRSPSNEMSNIDSPRRRIFPVADDSSAKPMKVVGLQLNGQSYQYLVKCHGETQPRKFSSIDAKNKFPDLVVDYYEKTAVVSAIKIDHTSD